MKIRIENVESKPDGARFTIDVTGKKPNDITTKFTDLLYVVNECLSDGKIDFFFDVPKIIGSIRRLIS